MSKSRRNYLISIFLILVAIIYTILVKKIDLSPIGPNESVVGFSKINLYFYNLIGVNMDLYKITEIFGYISLLLVAGYGIIGLIQMIKRKSIIKVDKSIIALGIFYIIVLGIYVFFEKFVINYRPVLIDNVLEASYPSSHTVLAICVCISGILVNKKLFNDKSITKYLNISFIVLMIAILFGRILSGVHWISDIFGGVLISIALLKTFKTILENIKEKL